MNRADLQALATTRLVEARDLLRSGHASGAYYLAGYAVECALKACIARQVRRFEFPDKTTVDASYTHSLTKLVGVAGLDTSLNADRKSTPALDINWAVVKDWNEASRYRTPTLKEARDLVTAIGARKYGVLSWLKRRW